MKPNTFKPDDLAALTLDGTLRLGPWTLRVMTVHHSKNLPSDGPRPAGLDLSELGADQWTYSAIADILDDSAYGIFNPTGPYIFLTASMPYARRRPTLMHELGHAMAYCLGLDRNEMSEHMANLLADALTQIIDAPCFRVADAT